MGDKKKIIIGVLCTLVAIMAVGYAALATQLNITGTASIDSTWKVEITNITQRDIVGGATNKVDPSYTATTANFSVGLIQPGDSITYDIEVSNLGTLKAKVDSINITMDTNDAIIYKTEGLASGDTLGVNEKDTLSVTVTYNPEVTSQPNLTTKEITVTINYVQDLGQSSSVTYDTYSIGDVVSFAGSNWYVIKNSSSGEDYVTLMKEKVLTGAELGEYTASQKIQCNQWMVNNGEYGCTTLGETVTISHGAMSYYWSDTCHNSEYYGYTDKDYSGCSGHNDYEGSKVKEFLEGRYINTLGENNLKEVDGYKIRLITLEELQANFGYSNELLIEHDTYLYNGFPNVPDWVTNYFGENTYGFSYWTMTPVQEEEIPINIQGVSVWDVNSDDGFLHSSHISSVVDCVRPVINLLKSSI